MPAEVGFIKVSIFIPHEPVLRAVADLKAESTFLAHFPKNGDDILPHQVNELGVNNFHLSMALEEITLQAAEESIVNCTKEGELEPNSTKPKKECKLFFTDGKTVSEGNDTTQTARQQFDQLYDKQTRKYNMNSNTNLEISRGKRNSDFVKGATGLVANGTALGIAVHTTVDEKNTRATIENYQNNSNNYIKYQSTLRMKVEETELEVTRANNVFQSIKNNTIGHIKERMDRKVSIVEKLVYNHRNIHTLARNNRLAAEIFSPQQHEEIHQDVNAKAAELKVVNLVTSADYYLKPDRKFITFFQTTKGLLIVIDVPYVQPNSTLMKLYMYKPLGIPIDNRFNSRQRPQSALFIESSHEIIAVGENNATYRLLKYSDLNMNCMKLKGKHICKKLPLPREGMANSCLGSLFLQDEDNIKHQCKFNTKNLLEDFVYLGNNDFYFISSENTTRNMVCPDKNITKVEITALQYTKLRIPSACTLMGGELHPTKDTVYTVSNWKLSNLTYGPIHDQDTKESHDALMQFNSKQKQNYSREIQQTHGNISTTVVFILFGIVGMMLCYCFSYRYIRARRRRPICTTSKTSTFKTSTTKSSTFSPKTSIVNNANIREANSNCMRDVKY
jgi:hypothetical protein